VHNFLDSDHKKLRVTGINKLCRVRKELKYIYFISSPYNESVLTLGQCQFRKETLISYPRRYSFRVWRSCEFKFLIEFIFNYYFFWSPLPFFLSSCSQQNTFSAVSVALIAVNLYSLRQF